MTGRPWLPPGRPPWLPPPPPPWWRGLGRRVAAVAALILSNPPSSGKDNR